MGYNDCYELNLVSVSTEYNFVVTNDNKVCDFKMNLSSLISSEGGLTKFRGSLPLLS